MARNLRVATSEGKRVGAARIDEIRGQVETAVAAGGRALARLLGIAEEEGGAAFANEIIERAKQLGVVHIEGIGQGAIAASYYDATGVLFFGEDLDSGC